MDIKQDVYNIIENYFGQKIKNQFDTLKQLFGNSEWSYDLVVIKDKIAEQYNIHFTEPISEYFSPYDIAIFVEGWVNAGYDKPKDVTTPFNDKMEAIFRIINSMKDNELEILKERFKEALNNEYSNGPLTADERDKWFWKLFKF